MPFLETLIVGSYLFTALAIGAGARGFFFLYRLITNHQAHRFEKIEERLNVLEEEE